MIGEAWQQHAIDSFGVSVRDPALGRPESEASGDCLVRAASDRYDGTDMLPQATTLARARPSPSAAPNQAMSAAGWLPAKVSTNSSTPASR